LAACAARLRRCLLHRLVKSFAPFLEVLHWISGQKRVDRFISISYFI
jgi:hypothetical protein